MKRSEWATSEPGLKGSRQEYKSKVKMEKTSALKGEWENAISGKPMESVQEENLAVSVTTAAGPKAADTKRRRKTLRKEVLHEAAVHQEGDIKNPSKRAFFEPLALMKLLLIFQIYLLSLYKETTFKIYKTGPSAVSVKYPRKMSWSVLYKVRICESVQLQTVFAMK